MVFVMVNCILLSQPKSRRDSENNSEDTEESPPYFIMEKYRKTLKRTVFETRVQESVTYGVRPEKFE